MSELGFAYGIFRALEPKWTDWKSNHGDCDHCKISTFKKRVVLFKISFHTVWGHFCAQEAKLALKCTCIGYLWLYTDTHS